MAAELEKLARQVEIKGYEIGASYIRNLSVNLLNKGLVPDFLEEPTSISQDPTFSGKIKEYRNRKDNKVSQRQLANKISLDHSVISRIEGGLVKSPSMSSIAKLARGLNLNSEQIIDLLGSLKS